MSDGSQELLSETIAKPERSDKSGRAKGGKGKGKGKGKGPSRGVDTMFRTSYRVNMDLSSLADTKANIMISINGLIMSILFAAIGPKIDSNQWLLIPTAILLLTCLLSMVYAVRSARPRVPRHKISLDDVRSGRSNLLFFGNFTSLSEDDFVTGMDELVESGSEVYPAMSRDLYGLGSVLLRKFGLLRTSYTLFMVGIIVSTIAFMVVFMGQIGPR